MFEEVKEMIDSTIYTNGRGEVTAQNINLAMHGMVDATEEELGKINDAVKAVEDKVTALEENGTGGDVAYVYVPYDNQLSDIQIEENKKSYVKILNGADLKVNIMGAIGNAEFSRIESGVITFGVTVHGVREDSSGARSIYHEYFLCILSNDGTVIVDAVNDSNPAPRGPLRVWINEENTPEQIAENVATYNVLARRETPIIQLIVVLDEGDLYTHVVSIPEQYSLMVSTKGDIIVEILAKLGGDSAYITLREDGSVTFEGDVN